MNHPWQHLRNEILASSLFLPDLINRRKRSPLRLLLVKFLFGLIRSRQTINVSPEFDDFAEQVIGFALPVGHGFVVVGVARGVLQVNVSRIE